MYQHEESRRVADPANRVTQEVGEEGELAAGSDLTPPLHIFHSHNVFLRVEFSHHYHTLRTHAVFFFSLLSLRIYGTVAKLPNPTKDMRTQVLIREDYDQDRSFSLIELSR
jgi:hypothetical protein